MGYRPWMACQAAGCLAAAGCAASPRERLLAAGARPELRSVAVTAPAAEARSGSRLVEAGDRWLTLARADGRRRLFVGEQDDGSPSARPGAPWAREAVALAGFPLAGPGSAGPGPASAPDARCDASATLVAARAGSPGEWTGAGGAGAPRVACGARLSFASPAPPHRRVLVVPSEQGQAQASQTEDFLGRWRDAEWVPVLRPAGTEDDLALMGAVTHSRRRPGPPAGLGAGAAFPGGPEPFRRTHSISVTGAP